MIFFPIDNFEFVVSNRKKKNGVTVWDTRKLKMWQIAFVQQFVKTIYICKYVFAHFSNDRFFHFYMHPLACDESAEKTIYGYLC